MRRIRPAAALYHHGYAGATARHARHNVEHDLVLSRDDEVALRHVAKGDFGEAFLETAVRAVFTLTTPVM